MCQDAATCAPFPAFRQCPERAVLCLPHSEPRCWARCARGGGGCTWWSPSCRLPSLRPPPRTGCRPSPAAVGTPGPPPRRCAPARLNEPGGPCTCRGTKSGKGRQVTTASQLVLDVTSVAQRHPRTTLTTMTSVTKTATHKQPTTTTKSTKLCNKP